MLIVDISQRPAIREWTSRSASRSDSVGEALGEIVAAPHRLAEHASPRPTATPRRARDVGERALQARVIARRSRPTRRVSQTNSGTSANEISARRQSSSAIVIVVAITVVAFWAIVVAVLVATLSIPPMSLAIRDWTSPARVRVKKASDRRWRWR